VAEASAAEPVVAADRAGITAFRGMLSTRPARRLNLVVREKRATGVAMPGPNTTNMGRGLYPLSGSDRYSFFTGIVQHGPQVLMGLYCPSLVALCFEPDGRFVGPHYRRLPYLDHHAWMVDNYRFLDDLRAWQEELGFRPCTIRVQKFSLVDADSNPEAISPDWPVHIEIRDEPDSFDKFRAGESPYCDEMNGRFIQQQMAEWERRERFVLYWRVQEFVVDGSGRF
jgi:hypothetical protein